MKSKRINTVETARIVKQILKDYFPDTKFSVTSKKYSGGSSVSVNWIDGPKESQVKEITDYFEGADFDGMRDLKTYKSKYEIDKEGNQIEVKYGPDFIFTNRKYSEKFTREIAQLIISEWGLDDELLDRIKLHRDGKTAWWDVMTVRPEGWPMDLGTRFHRYRCQIEADKNGSIKKYRISANYLKKLAARAYAEDDEYIFTEEVRKKYNMDYEQSWDLYQQYLKSVVEC